MIFLGITIFYICMFSFQQTSNNQIVIDNKANTCAHDIQIKNNFNYQWSTLPFKTVTTVCNQLFHK